MRQPPSSLVLEIGDILWAEEGFGVHAVETGSGAHPGEGYTPKEPGPNPELTTAVAISRRDLLRGAFLERRD